MKIPTLNEANLVEQLAECALREPIVANWLRRYDDGEFCSEIAFAGMVVDLCKVLGQFREKRILDKLLETPVIVMGPATGLSFQLLQTHKFPWRD